MVDRDLSGAFEWVKARLGRELCPLEKQFIETGGLAHPDTYDVAISRRPEARTDENYFDARLIRWLLTNEVPSVTCRPQGVEVRRLWIEKELDLATLSFDLPLNAFDCFFNARLNLRATTLRGLNLTGSLVHGISANSFKCHGVAQLRNNFVSRGAIELQGAHIEGQLSCSGGKFESSTEMSMDCDAISVGSDVLLTSNFNANATINFRGADIKGQFACNGSESSNCTIADLWLDAAKIGGDVFFRKIEVRGRIELCRTEVKGNLHFRLGKFEGDIDVEGAKIDGGFFWEDISGKVELLDLTETKVGRLSDDATSWFHVNALKLSGFRYDSLQSDMTVADRLNLLARKWEREIPSPTRSRTKRKDFDPQPYSQLAKVYDTMGHRMDAAKVRFARDERLMWAAFFRAMRQPKPDTLGKALACVSLVWGYVYRDTFGYGHAPFKALRTALLVLIATWWLADQTYQRGEFAPASPVVLASPEWLIASAFGCPGAQEPGCTMPLRRWEQSVSYRDYETFSPALYALDLFLPLDTLAQEESWAPSKDRGPWGWTLYWGRWLIQLSGWLLLTTAAAVFSGVLGKKD